MDLRARAEEFLRRPYPNGEPVPDNITDGLITRFVAGGPRDDPELHDLLTLCLMIARQAVNEETGEARAFYEESAAVLEGIQASVSGDPVSQGGHRPPEA